MSSKDNTNLAPGHRRAKSHDVPSAMAVDGHPRPSWPGSVPTYPRVFGLGLGFGSADSELGALASAQAAPETSAAEQPIMGPITVDAGEGVVSASSSVRRQVSKPPSITATGAPLPPIQKGAASQDPAGEEAASAAPRPPASKVAIQGQGSSAAVRSQNVVVSSAVFQGLMRTVPREEPDRVDRPTAPPQLLEGFVSPRRHRKATIRTGPPTGLNSNIESRPVTPVRQVIPSYDQRREMEDAWLRHEEQRRREWERERELGIERFLADASRRQQFPAAGRRAPVAPSAAARSAFLGRPRGNSQASALEQASAFGNVVPGPSRRAEFVSVPAGGYGNVDHQARIRSPRAAVGSYIESPGHGPYLGSRRVDSQGAQTECPSPRTPEGMSREMYEAMCAFAEDVRQEEDGEVEENEGAAGADAASLRMPMPGINQHGDLELPRGLTQEEFLAEQAQLLADAAAFSELVSAQEEEEAAIAREAEDSRRAAMGPRQPRFASPGHSVSPYFGTGTLDAALWQQAEDELWDVLNRRRVPSYDERGELVFPTSPTAAEIARERAAILKRVRRQAEEAEGASRAAERGEEGHESPMDRNPRIPFGMPEDLYDQACAFNEQVRQEEAERERLEGQAGPSQSPLPAPLACPPGQIAWGVTEEGLIEAWRRHVAQQPAESQDPPAADSAPEQHGARPPVHHLADPFDDRDVAAFSRSAVARSGFVGRAAGSSARNATRASYHPAEISTGSPRFRGRGVVRGEYVAPPEHTPLPGRRAMRTPSPSVYSRTSGFGTAVPNAVQRPSIGGVSGPNRDDVFGSPSLMLTPVFSGNQRRNLSSNFEQVNSGFDRVDEESSGEGREEEGEKGKMVVRNTEAACASSPSLSDGESHGPRWVYESPSVGKMDFGPSRDKGKRKATAEEVAAQVAEEKLLKGTSASPVASERQLEGIARAPSSVASLSETLLDDSGSSDNDDRSNAASPPPPPPSSAEPLTAVAPGAHRTLDLDEGFQYDAGIEPPKSTRQKVAGGLRGLARGLKDKLKPSSRKASRSLPAPTAASPRPEIVDREANQSTASGLSGGGRPSVFASLAGRFTPRPGSSASVHRAPIVQAGGTGGSWGSRHWPARRSSLARAFSIPNLRSPSMTADTLNKPLPQTPLFVVAETPSIHEETADDVGQSGVDSVELRNVAAGQSLRRGRNVSFAGTQSVTRWLQSSGSAPEIVTGGEERSPIRAQQQQRIQELEAALQLAESSRLAAEARASSAEDRLARVTAELDVYVAEATGHQRALTAQRVEFQLQLNQARGERGGEAERHAAEIERQHARHLDYLRVIEGNHAAERQALEHSNAMLYSAVGGLQAQLLHAGTLRPQPGGQAATHRSLQAAPAAQQEGAAANEPPQQPAEAEFVYLGPRPRYGSRLPEPGLFQILPHPIPLPPQQPPFAPSDSVRLRNRAERLAAGQLGPEHRQRIRRRADPDSD